jgi:hypothetical protein
MGLACVGFGSGTVRSAKGALTFCGQAVDIFDRHPMRPAMRRTKTEQYAVDRFYNRTSELRDDPLSVYDLKKLIPKAWFTLDQDLPVTEPKVKITLRLDQSVIDFFRATGPGYQTRINRLLATYAQMKIAQVENENAELAAFRKSLRMGIDPDTGDIHGAPPVEE